MSAPFDGDACREFYAKQPGCTSPPHLRSRLCQRLEARQGWTIPTPNNVIGDGNEQFALTTPVLDNGLPETQATQAT